MKHLFTAIIVCAGFCNAMAQSAKEGKIIFKGVADPKYNGDTIVLYNRKGNDNDSAVIQNGRYELSALFKEPKRYMFYSKRELKRRGKYNIWGILVSKPGEIKIKTNVDSMAASTVSGAPENELYNQFRKKSAAERQKITDQLNEKYGNKFVDTITKTNPRYEEVVADYDRLNNAYKAAEEERVEKFIKKYPATFAAVNVLYAGSFSISPAKLEELYNRLSPAWKESQIAKNVEEKINTAKSIEIGKIAPEFTQTDTLGKNVSLKDFRGKYVLIDFWASWCGPCREENPNVVNAFNKFKDKGFTILGVSLDGPNAKDKWIEAIHKDNLTWTHVSDLKFWGNAVAKLYGIQSIPRNFLLDKEGRIIATNLRGEALDKKLEEVIQ